MGVERSAKVLRFSDYEARPPTWPREPDQVDSVIILPVVRVEKRKLNKEGKSR